MAEQPVRVDVWSDYVCPFCFLVEPTLEQLRKDYGESVQVHWRAFELRPEPVPTLDPAGEKLRSTWQRVVYPMAEEREMTIRLPPVQPRSRKAFEAAQFAREAGKFDAFHPVLFRAFFLEGRDIGELAVLRELAASVGLDGEALGRALAEGRYTERVVRDREQALAAGVTGVPAMLVLASEATQGVMVSGTQPYEVLQEALEHARRGPLPPKPPA
ncbi:DsbA family oxidoreductase [Hyalangium sp.]|uniref:DsbA family oxidoreductase n=1 Tax=Hyalangium sp. TaxID=2028555 RepID=UPI002D2BAD60|nr:DsbA family oxidoreductase [Hyalangium sp.]HYH94398.1 DsbA family oxidoreductase [Hyalangium sp.]